MKIQNICIAFFYLQIRLCLLWQNEVPTIQKIPVEGKSPSGQEQKKVPGTLVHTVFRPHMPGCSKHSSISVRRKENTWEDFVFQWIVWSIGDSICTSSAAHFSARITNKRACTCAGVRGARYHVEVVQSIAFVADAGVRSDWIGAVGVRSADSRFFYAFVNICPQKYIFFTKVSNTRT